jgi:hypothetical protein
MNGRQTARKFFIEESFRDFLNSYKYAMYLKKEEIASIKEQLEPYSIDKTAAKLRYKQAISLARRYHMPNLKDYKLEKKVELLAEYDKINKRGAVRVEALLNKAKAEKRTLRFLGATKLSLKLAVTIIRGTWRRVIKPGSKFIWRKGIKPLIYNLADKLTNKNDFENLGKDYMYPENSNSVRKDPIPLPSAREAEKTLYLNPAQPYMKKDNVIYLGPAQPEPTLQPEVTTQAPTSLVQPNKEPEIKENNAEDSYDYLNNLPKEEIIKRLIRTEEDNKNLQSYINTLTKHYQIGVKYEQTLEEANNTIGTLKTEIDNLKSENSELKRQVAEYQVNQMANPTGNYGTLPQEKTI